MSGFYDVDSVVAKAMLMQDKLFASALEQCSNDKDKSFLMAQHRFAKAATHMRAERMRLQNDGFARSIVLASAAMTAGILLGELLQMGGMKEHASIAFYFQKAVDSAMGAEDDTVLGAEMNVMREMGGRA